MSVSDDKTAKLWDIQRLKQMKTMKKHTGIIFDCEFSFDNTTMATCSVDKTVFLWSLKGKAIAALRGHSAPVNSIAFLGEQNKLASASSDKTIRIWDTENFTTIRTIAEHTKAVLDIIASPDGKTLISNSNDGTVRVWSLVSFKEIGRLNFGAAIPNALAFDTQNRFWVVACRDKKLKFYKS